MLNRCSDFRNAMLEMGLTPPEVIEPGRFYRFPGRDKRSSNRAGWCIGFADGLGGTFGDWSSGLTVDWQARRDRPLSHSEREAQERQFKAARAAAAAWQSQERRAVRGYRPFIGVGARAGLNTGA